MNKEMLVKKIRNMSKILTIVLVAYLILPIRDAVMGFMDGWNEAAAEDAAGVEAAPMTAADRILFVNSLAIIVLIIAVIIMAFKIMRNLSTGESPFTEQNSNRIKKLSVTMLSVGVVEFATFVILQFFDGYEGMGFFSGTTFITGVILYCISLVFRYGCELQQESDETI